MDSIPISNSPRPPLDTPKSGDSSKDSTTNESTTASSTQASTSNQPINQQLSSSSHNPHQHHHHHHHHHHRSSSHHHRSSHHHHHRHSSSGSSAGGGAGSGGTNTTTGSNSIIRNNHGWFQRKINMRPVHRGCHLVTDEVVKQVPEMSQFQVGICNLHIMHTSASLTMNENWDPDVREDMEMFLLQFVPENLPFRHVCEGPDDMPAHVKASFLGSSLTIPITDGKLCLGTWQGIWLCEHRNNAGSRKIMVTINGALKD